MTSEIGSTHAHPVSTEVQAAKKIGPHLNTLRTTVYDLIEKAGVFGMTPDEMIVATGALDYSIRPRFNDLWDDGLIKRSGAERPNRRGNNESVWVTGKDENHVAPAEVPTAPAPTPVLVPACPGCAVVGRHRPLPQKAIDATSARCDACKTIITWGLKTSH